jgi:aspartyl-tRNA(Asn)/glutamyl-tRNA(Gln) amidotransferase subunit C
MTSVLTVRRALLSEAGAVEPATARAATANQSRDPGHGLFGVEPGLSRNMRRNLRLCTIGVNRGPPSHVERPRGVVYHDPSSARSPAVRITLDEISHIAHLAHLELDPGEMESLRGDLDRILQYIDKLGELDTLLVPDATGPEAIDPPGRAIPGVSHHLRADRPGPTLAPEDALANAPESAAGHFKVPKII